VVIFLEEGTLEASASRNYGQSMGLSHGSIFSESKNLFSHSLLPEGVPLRLVGSGFFVLGAVSCRFSPKAGYSGPPSFCAARALSKERVPPMRKEEVELNLPETPQAPPHQRLEVLNKFPPLPPGARKDPLKEIFRYLR